MSGEAGSLEVWSPATESTFATLCDADGEQIFCTTTDGGVVKFPQTAVDLYSQGQADSYAETHDLGPNPHESLPLADPTRPPRRSCDPNYKGDCLDPGAVDYDCEGGSGNGPVYAGPVRVVGDDPYGLDADSDGFACE